MMKKDFLIYFTFFTLISFCIHAQETFGFVQGEIVKKTGDTIKCFVPMTVNYGPNVKYKIKINSPEVNINTADIKFLKTPYNTFENISYDKHEQLMTILSAGNVTLYSCIFYDDPKTKYNNDGSSLTTSNENYINYLIKKENILYEVKHKNFKDLMKAQLIDCSNVIAKIDSKKYKFKDIQTVIEEYNSCK